MRRPGSLTEVASFAQSAKELGYAVAEFLDQFYREKNAAMVADEPPLLQSQLQDEGVADDVGREE